MLKNYNTIKDNIIDFLGNYCYNYGNKIAKENGDIICLNYQR